MPHDLEAIAQRALELIPDNSVVGLGTGHAATAFIEALGQKVAGGFHVRGIPTSQASAELAQSLGIALTTFDQVESIDVDVDGADEVDPQGNLIKGYGGALLREKIVAAASRRLVILVGDEKLVPQLGSHGILPVEVVPFALETSSRRLVSLGLVPEPRRRDGRLFLTDNGNHILDCRIQPLPRPEETERAIRDIPGVVGTGLFLNMSPTVLIGRGGNVEVREYEIRT
ncbi:MAG TPA: ribose-5-phosphate isomerase RpiA [Pirellulales bacterium]